MAADLLIRNGTVIDPARKVHAVGDVATADGRIVEVDGTGATTEIDAAGCLVVPGLIDNHAHVFAAATDGGIRADVSCLPHGVTSLLPTPLPQAGLPDPIADRLRRRFELPRQLLGIAAGADQINHLTSKLGRVRRTRLAHGMALL